MQSESSHQVGSALKSALAGACVMAAIMGVGRFIYTPILPHMVEEGALTIGQAGSLASANYLGYLVGAVLASFSFLGGRRANWLYLGFFLSLFTTALMAIDAGFVYFSIVRFVSGIASALAMIFSTAIVSDIFRASGRPGYRAIHFAGVGVGISLSALIVSHQLGLSFGALHPVSSDQSWQGLWLSGALLAGCAFPVMWLLLGQRPGWPDRQRRPKGVSSSNVGFEANSEKVAEITAESDLEKSEPAHKNIAAYGSGFWWLVISYGFFGYGYIITATFISALAKSEPALQSTENLVWLAVGLAGIPSIWIWNRIASVTSHAFAYVSACLLEAIGVALSVLIISPVSILVSAILMGLTFIPITAIGLALAQHLIQKHTDKVPQKSSLVPDFRQAIGIMTVAFAVGQIIGPALAGWLYEQAGDFYWSSLSAVMALVACAAIAFFATRGLKA